MQAISFKYRYKESKCCGKNKRLFCCFNSLPLSFLKLSLDAKDLNDGGDFYFFNENVVHGDRAQFVATYRQPTLNQPKFRLMASGTDDVTIHSSNSMSQCD